MFLCATFHETYKLTERFQAVRDLPMQAYNWCDGVQTVDSRNHRRTQNDSLACRRTILLKVPRSVESRAYKQAFVSQRLLCNVSYYLAWLDDGFAHLYWLQVIDRLLASYGVIWCISMKEVISWNFFSYPDNTSCGYTRIAHNHFCHLQVRLWNSTSEVILAQ